MTGSGCGLGLVAPISLVLCSVVSGCDTFLNCLFPVLLPHPLLHQPILTVLFVNFAHGRPCIWSLMWRDIVIVGEGVFSSVLVLTEVGAGWGVQCRVGVNHGSQTFLSVMIVQNLLLSLEQNLPNIGPFIYKVGVRPLWEFILTFAVVEVVIMLIQVSWGRHSCRLVHLKRGMILTTFFQ